MLLSLGFSLTLFASPVQSPVSVAGWSLPSFDKKEPSAWLANDPVFGRLICPSLTRLNLVTKESEALVLKNINVERKGSSVFWNLGLRTGIYWWSAKELDASDIADFIKKNLAKIVDFKGSGQWTLPNYEIQLEKESVRILWKKEPEFGPYIFNGIAFWKPRAHEDIAFECVGRFIPSSSEGGWLLTPNAKYQSHLSSVRIESLEDFRSKKRRGYEFQMAEDQNPAKKNAQEKIQCENLLDLPMISAVLWSDNAKLTQEIRRRMSTLFPREALRQIATGHWSNLQSSLIPKSHPGYDLAIATDAFALSRSNDRKPLFLNTVRGKIGLPEKVISDTLLVGGFDVQFVSNEDERLDGMVTGIMIPWPEMDMFDAFHSKGRNVLGRRKNFDTELDKEFDIYRRSLTQQTPDFKALKRIHKHLHRLEWVSVLMQHQACLEMRGMAKKKKIEVKDPDWFLDLLTM